MGLVDGTDSLQLLIDHGGKIGVQFCAQQLIHFCSMWYKPMEQGIVTGKMYPCFVLCIYDEP